MTLARSKCRSLAVAAALIASISITTALNSPPASAAADANMVPVVAARLLDTRPGQTTVDGQHAGAGRVDAGTFYRLPVAGRGGVAPDAEAVMLNVTAVVPDELGYLTVYPCSATPPNTSNVNYFAGQVIPNSVLAKVASDGSVCIFSLATTDIVVDVTGYVPVAGSPVAVDPARLVETRPASPVHTTIDGESQNIGRAEAGETISFVAAGRGGVPADAEAVYLNVTAIFPSGPGFLTVHPCGSDRPETSNVNYGAGDVRPNAVLATVGTGGRVCIYTLVDADIIADVNGYLPPGGNRVAIEPARCADTRPDGETFDGLFAGDGKIAAGGMYAVRVAGRCNIDADASAAYLNVTAVNPEAPGFLTIWPCDQPRPTASNVNYQTGEVSPNAVLSKVSLDGDGQICIYSLARTDVIVDVNGYVPEPGLFGVTQLASGSRITCALMSDRTVRCAGQSGYTGTGDYGDQFDPALVADIDDAVILEAGGSAACAVLADTTARCWGSNGNGQLGNGTDVGTGDDAFDRQLSPTAVEGLDQIVDLSLWDDHTCAITDDDQNGVNDGVWCWGRNNYDQLGDASDTEQWSPVPVLGLPGAKEPIDVEAGGSHTCLLYDDGTVWCWGHGGRVGRVTGSSSGQTPQQVDGLSTASQLSAGGSHTCALITDGTVECWGLDESEALGPRDGAISNLLPATVTGVAGVVEVIAGDDLTCVRHADRSVECWGSNGYGQTGDLSPQDVEATPVPMRTQRDADIMQVTNNGLHSCALLADSSVVCWGYNFHGNLGVRLNNHTATPVVYGSGDLRD
ncbi:MAG: hypothetical protein R8G01_05335 [Ilumatobacteraceae bacterium]|nr:hypothetical protein [Ilumatobacteraceae bacterium]